MVNRQCSEQAFKPNMVCPPDPCHFGPEATNSIPFVFLFCPCALVHVHVRYHPPGVPEGVHCLEVARERLAAAHTAAWGRYLQAREHALVFNGHACAYVHMHVDFVCRHAQAMDASGCC